MGLYVYVYNTTQTTTSTNPLSPGITFSANTPILEVRFGLPGSNLVHTSMNGWYWLSIPSNTYFSCAADGFKAAYGYSNGYGYLTVGMQPINSK